MTGTGEAMLRTPIGIAFLATAAAVGRLEQALAEPGRTLCLAGHAVAEVRRGTDGGRIDELLTAPPAWVRAAAALVDEADTTWWSTPAVGAVHRRLDHVTTGIEVRDAQGRPRSAAEEASAHLRPFTSRDRADPPDRLLVGADIDVLTVDGPDDLTDHALEALSMVGSNSDDGPDALHLTLHGALTTTAPAAVVWPWDVAGVVWPLGVPLLETAPPQPAVPGTVVHDHGWPPIGRPHDPRFDEGDEIDGSEMAEAD